MTTQTKKQDQAGERIKVLSNYIILSIHVVNRDYLAGASSKTYILRSALDTNLVALANKPDAELTAAGQADLDRLATRNKTVNAEDEETLAAASRAGVSILGWEVGGEGEGEWYNVMCVVLGLVLVNGRSVADRKSGFQIHAA